MTEFLIPLKQKHRAPENIPKRKNGMYKARTGNSHGNTKLPGPKPRAWKDTFAPLVHHNHSDEDIARIRAAQKH